jgi:hypothetical protein
MPPAPPLPDRFRAALERHPAAALGVLLTGLIAATYGHFLASPDRFFVGDLVNLFQPLRHLLRAAIGQGELPLWTPAYFAGAPVLADPQAAVFYPGTYLLLLGPYPATELAAFLLHLGLAGAGMAWLARGLGIGRAGAAFAALSVSLSGFFTAHLVHPNFVHTAAWLPWLLGAGLRLVTGGGGRAAALTAGLTALALLAGGTQLAYYGLAAMVFLGLTTGLALPAPWTVRGVRLAQLGGALALGVAAAAVQLWPAAELAALSVRADGVTLDLAQTYRLPPAGLLQLLVPFGLGLPGQTPYLGGQDFHEAFAYVGALALPLAGVALARRPTTPRLAVAVLVGLAVLAALGPDGPVDLLRWLFRYAPGFDRFRAHGRLLVLVVLGLALLAAWGLDDLLADDAADRGRGPLLAATGLAVGAALAIVLLTRGAGSPWPRAAGALAARSAWMTVALLVAAATVLLHGRRLGIAPAVLAAGVLALHGVDLVATGRTLVASRPGPEGVAPAREVHRLPAELLRAVGPEHRLLFAADSYYMLQNLGALHGYDNLRAYGPMMLRRTYDLLHLADSGRFAPWRRLPVDQNLIAVRRTDAPVLRLLGVSHVVSHDRPRQGKPNFRARPLSHPLPRAFVVYRTERAADRASREARLRTFDPAQVALVETDAAGLGPGPELAATPAAIGPRPASGSRVRIRARAEREGLLVLAEAWHPGWRARVDGRAAAVHRVNHGLMGVRLPPGEHDVRLELAPASLRRGAWASALAWLLIAGLGLSAWRRRRALAQGES